MRPLLVGEALDLGKGEPLPPDMLEDKIRRQRPGAISYLICYDLRDRDSCVLGDQLHDRDLALKLARAAKRQARCQRHTHHPSHSVIEPDKITDIVSAAYGLGEEGARLPVVVARRELAHALLVDRGNEGVACAVDARL